MERSQKMVQSRAHPHRRGEHFTIPTSPVVCGLIPTGVGNTHVQAEIGPRHGAHPHGRGEHQQYMHHFAVKAGSSPRVWGTRPRSPRLQRCGGAHPHGCGEHEYDRLWREINGGSSPRVWGTHRGFYRFGRYRGLILTGVGNTARDRLPRPRLRAHPHGCGEHTGEFRAIDVDPGSSPRVWGTPAYQCHYHAQSRLIPTGVGNTPGRARSSTTGWAHPHGCGEHHRLAR